MTRSLFRRVTALALALMLGAGVAVVAPAVTPAIAGEFGCQSDGGGGGGGVPTLSSNATLSSLTISAGTLSPAFSPATNDYTTSVGYLTTEITVGAMVADAYARMTINGDAVTSRVVPLAVGSNPITIVTTAQDGTTKTTTIVATRAAPSGNSALSGLAVSGGTLSPGFDPSTMSYTVSAPSTAQFVAFALTSADATATISTPDSTISSGGTILRNLQVGTNVFTFLVTAQDGSTSTYTVTVTRASPNDATLSGIALSAGTLSPAFSASTTNYATTVSYLTDQITVDATTADSGASRTINSPERSGPTIPLSVGENTIFIVTTAADGFTTQTTTIVVTREAPNLGLDALSVSGGTLSPAFDTDTTAYTLALPFTVSSVDVAATATESGRMPKHPPRPSPSASGSARSRSP